jgi:hypothetical protein
MSNDTVRASAPALPKSRRAALGLFASASALAVLPAATMAAGSDAELFALTPQITLTDEAEREAGAVCDALEDVFFSAIPPEPTPPKFDISDEEWFKALQAKTASDKNKAAPKEQTAYQAAIKEHEQRRDRLRVDCGLEAAEQKQNDTQDAVMSLRDRIAEIPATTLAGLIFKARYAASHYEGEYDADVMTSIVDDLLALNGEA